MYITLTLNFLPAEISHLLKIPTSAAGQIPNTDCLVFAGSDPSLLYRQVSDEGDEMSDPLLCI